MTDGEALAEANEAIERLCNQVPLLPVRPIVVDSDVLLPNLMWDANPAKPPSKLLIQAGMGGVRPYIAPHQLDEVRRHIPEVAARTGIDENRARHIFERRYVPVLWSAETEVTERAEFLAYVSIADPDDVPTARLAALLGVRVVTRNKKHFGHLAIEDDWLTVVGAYASASLLDGANAGILVSARVSGHGARAAERAVKGGFDFLRDHPKLALAAGIILVMILFVGIWYLSDDERRLKAWEAVKRTGPPAARLAGRALQSYLELAGMAVEAEAVILASKLPRAELTLDQRLAEYLARQRFATPLETLIDGVSPRAGQLISATLRSNPAFVEDDNGWTLGHRCLPAAGV